MKLLLLIVLNCWAGGETVPIESLDKPGALQAMQQAFDDKFSIRGGTITGTSLFSSSVTVKGILSAETNASFTGSASTVTLSGWLGIAITTATAQCNGVMTCTVSCPFSYKAISGGCNINASATNLTQQEPSDANWTGWHCQAAGGTPNITAYVICAKIRFDP